MIVWCVCLCVVIIVVDVFNKVTKTNSYVVFYVNKVVVNALQTTIVNNNIKHFCFIKHPNIQYYTNKTTAKCLHRHKLQHVCKVAHRTAPAGLSWSYILKTNDIRVIIFKHHIANTKVRHKPCIYITFRKVRHTPDRRFIYKFKHDVLQQNRLQI